VVWGFVATTVLGLDDTQRLSQPFFVDLIACQIEPKRRHKSFVRASRPPKVLSGPQNLCQDIPLVRLFTERFRPRPQYDARSGWRPRKRKYQARMAAVGDSVLPREGSRCAASTSETGVSTHIRQNNRNRLMAELRERYQH
jgi:hypothetical protein